MTIGEVSRLTGLTIRTLRHYDRIGLCRPVCTTEAGYRIYDEASLQRLHSIMMFRELEMPLEQIRRLLDMPGRDMQQALSLQRDLLAMRREHITRLMALTETIMQKGTTHMDFSAFDKRRMEDYTQQAEAAWGNTEAWQDYARREKTRQPGDSAAYGRELMDMLGKFGRSRPASPEAPEAQAFVAGLQDFISQHFYTCTTPVLRGLADMYETDDFRRNIDQAGGEGTATFIAEAIRSYCR